MSGTRESAATVPARPSGETPIAGGPLGHRVGVLAGLLDELVEVQMHVVELATDEVPVGLLGHERQVDQVDQGGLQRGTGDVAGLVLERAGNGASHRGQLSFVYRRRVDG